MEYFFQSYETTEQRESNQIFEEILDLNNDGSACIFEVTKYVSSQDNLWAMLSVALNKPQDECQAIATRVTMELASGQTGKEAMKTEISKVQFHEFREKYILNPQGTQEFFHKAIFATYDADFNAEWDEGDLDDFLDSVLHSDSTIRLFGHMTLHPPRDELKAIIMKRFDPDGTGLLKLEAVSRIIGGELANVKEVQVAAEAAEARRIAEEELLEARQAASEHLRRNGTMVGPGSSRRSNHSSIGMNHPLDDDDSVSSADWEEEDDDVDDKLQEQSATSHTETETETSISRSSFMMFSDFVDYAQETAEGLTREVAKTIFYTIDEDEDYDDDDDDDPTESTPTPTPPKTVRRRSIQKSLTFH